MTPVSYTHLFLSAQAYTFTPDKTLHSQAAILYNRDTEQVLYLSLIHI